jgi:hypothetical protein
MRSTIGFGAILTALLALSCDGDSGDTSFTDDGGAAAGGTTTGGAGGKAGSAGASSGGAAGGAASGGSSGAGGVGGSGGGPQATSGKLDLLVVVDNSISMADKQEVLRRSGTELVGRLTNPRCLDAQGDPAPTQPANPSENCPPGSEREMPPVRDMHVGVISSSLGGHGADVCSPAYPSWNETQNDRAHLLTRGPSGAVQTYEGRGYLAWDPEQSASPPGETNANTLATALGELVVGAGQTGCGFEATHEAWYRFLVDPAPFATLRLENTTAVLEGVDQELLDQRAAFLRPDSAVVIAILSDENDCSTIDGGVSWLSNQLATPGSGTGSFTLPRATAACATNPNDVCCRSCNLGEQSPPAGCAPLASDSECMKGPNQSFEDAINLRCFEQKRRFGIDFLYPLERYVDALTKTRIENRAGNLVDNPLLVGRDPSLVTVAAIVGVPWQDLARAPSDAQRLSYMNAAELEANDRWALIAGSPSGGPPTDPFMRESIEPRTGTNPVTGDSPQPPTAPLPTASPINGHEFNGTRGDDLQYACIFPLPVPRDCTALPIGCDCQSGDLDLNRPLCQAPSGAYGTTQYYAKAYPGLRHLRLLRQLGSGAVVASICPRNLDQAARPDYAFAPAVHAIIERLRVVIR